MAGDFFRSLWGKIIGALTILFLGLEIYNQVIAAISNTYQMELARANAAIKKQDADVLTSPSPRMTESEAWHQACEVEKINLPSCKHKPAD